MKEEEVKKLEGKINIHIVAHSKRGRTDFQVTAAIIDDVEKALTTLEQAVREEVCRYIASEMWYESRTAEDRLKKVLDKALNSPTT